MTVSLGLDIGSNSVGSAWVDTDRWYVKPAVSVFPAGVNEEDDGRGAPKNQERRSKRSLRRSLARRAARKRKLRQYLTTQHLLPTDDVDLQELFSLDPWALRRKGLDEKLSPHEFGRVLLHLCQRRGALGLRFADHDEPTNEDEEKESNAKKSKEASEAEDDQLVKAAVTRTRAEMTERKVRTFGELIAMVSTERRHPVLDAAGQPRIDDDGNPITYADHIRNRPGAFLYHADRPLAREEFTLLWEKQRSLAGELSALLTDEVKVALDDPRGDLVWRHKGLLFGQRRTYWRIETLGRCDLEPTDRCVPIVDRHASWFRVVESVNNIKMRGPGDLDFEPLNRKQRDAIIARLRTQKTGTIATVREALGIDKRTLKKKDLPESAFALNIERDEDREINTDWFHREIVGAVGEETWNGWDERLREAVNRAVLRFDPKADDDERFKAAMKKAGIEDDKVLALAGAWAKRPPLERRLKMSRRAVLNLLPYMERQDEKKRWPTQIEARRMFADDSQAIDVVTGEAATELQKARYQLGAARRNKADRHFQRKHPELLPPPPTLANPVARKAIHEVRRHVTAHIRAHGKRPDRVVIEFARETAKPKKESDRLLYLNRNRNKIRKWIQDEVVRPSFGDGRFYQLSHNQLRAAVDRVVLCVQQRSACAYSTGKLDASVSGPCAYSGRAITLRQAALGTDLEVDHIIPYSRCGDNSLNNRILCYRDSNRDKQQQTPREWWGDKFDDRVAPLRFMDGYKPSRDDYFTQREYATKWRNLSAAKVDAQWKGSQLTDTAYAAREVQAYLQQALWPGEPSHLEGGKRRIFVTKGRYTKLLRQDWQLYKQLRSTGQSTPEEARHAAAKNRGDHREHAIDAVAIALTDPERILEVAATITRIDEERAKAKAQGREPAETRRTPIAPPWQDVKAFRRQVLRQVYAEFDDMGRPARDEEPAQPLVVSHRAPGRKLTGAFHEETLFGPVPGGDGTSFTGHKPVSGLTPKHLRMPTQERKADAIERLAKRWARDGDAGQLRKLRAKAKAFVETKAYEPLFVDPPPEKSGIVRDAELRRILRAELDRRLKQVGLSLTCDNFSKSDLGKVLKQGPLRMPSGVPIRRVVLLRTMNDPVQIRRKRFDFQRERFVADESPRAGRAYVGGSNHHIEIRQDAKGRWSGYVMPTFEAARRVRMLGLDAVDRSDDEKRGGRYIMSLSEGETVYMRPKGTGEPDYFVVFKLDKPQTINFKAHWDARRAMGEKDEEGNLIPNSEREEMAVSATDLKSLAPPGEETPIKVQVDALGNYHRVEPPKSLAEPTTVDPIVLEVARTAIAERANRQTGNGSCDGGRQTGSWSWMLAEMNRRGSPELAPQLSAALRQLRENGDS